MAERGEKPIPGWAEQERASNLAWLRENLHIFWPASQLGYQTVGRGAIVVDTTLRPAGQDCFPLYRSHHSGYNCHTHAQRPGCIQPIPGYFDESLRYRFFCCQIVHK